MGMNHFLRESMQLNLRLFTPNAQPWERPPLVVPGGLRAAQLLSPPSRPPGAARRSRQPPGRCRSPTPPCAVVTARRGGHPLVSFAPPGASPTQPSPPRPGRTAGGGDAAEPPYCTLLEVPRPPPEWSAGLKAADRSGDSLPFTTLTSSAEFPLRGWGKHRPPDCTFFDVSDFECSQISCLRGHYLNGPGKKCAKAPRNNHTLYRAPPPGRDPGAAAAAPVPPRPPVVRRVGAALPGVVRRQRCLCLLRGPPRPLSHVHGGVWGRDAWGGLVELSSVLPQGTYHF